MTRMIVHVDAATGAYPVRVERGALDLLGPLTRTHAPAHRYAVVADSNVAELYGERALRSLGEAGNSATLFPFPAGESRKNRAEWGRLTDALLENGIGRDGAVIALGGGVTGDLAGFVAATYMRGIPVVQVPTSVVAMVDASVGGKAGVDVPAGKNLVGAFHAPRLVLVDPEVVGTLPREERARGWIEGLKHGAIRDADYFARLERDRVALLEGDADATYRHVVRSVEIKAAVVSEDERERGLREVLNFGHTLGHAIEATSGYTLSHGSAVGIGMVLEAALGERLGVTPTGLSERIAGSVSGLGLPTRLPPGIEPAEVVARTRADKKGRRGEPRYVLLEGLGSVSVDRSHGWARPVPDETVLEVFAAPADVSA